MTTEKQIQANRENAKQSTGPRTADGKKHSAQNATKHSLLAKQTVIPGEAPDPPWEKGVSTKPAQQRPTPASKTISIPTPTPNRAVTVRERSRLGPQKP